ncbi:alpha/beta hydrolase [Novosphingobium colocasiae]|uniref:Esterase n=1 Tax=Novosphingobium colocasiae TaxID=1256513 RepID=A0A918UEE7_9SPHN|nr:alpha/beta hydrolase [Novosphingobium colocasiae]GGY95663.1 esterase [Novosphingobium colocasiae]
MSQPFVLPETQAVLDLLAAQPGPHLADLPAADARAVYHLLGDLFEEPADLSVRTLDLPPDNTGLGTPLRAYFPGPAQAGPVIVYMHGGGFVIGDLDTHNAVCTLVARISGLRVVAVDYRLAPEHPYPAAHEDCLAAARFVAGAGAVLEAPVEGIAVAGDSAGGALACYLAARLGRDTVRAQLLIYPWLDATAADEGSYRDFAEGFLLDRRLMDRFITDSLPAGTDVAGPDLSPVRHPLPAHLPPAVIVSAGLDPLRDQARALAAAMAVQGLECHFLEARGLIHGIATMRKALPSGDAVIRRATTIFADMIRATTA